MSNVILTTEELFKEVWKPVKGWEEFYEVSDMGRCRSLDRMVVDKNGMQTKRKGRMLIVSDTGKSRTVCLAAEGNKKTHSICVLVMLHFGPKPEFDDCKVHHEDGDIGNNRYSNLTWKHNEDSGQALSNYYGVHLRTVYTADIRLSDGRRLRIGSFNTELQAAEAYDKYVIENDLQMPINNLIS